MNELKKRIEGKTCFVLLSGASLEDFRRTSRMFKDYDVAWCGINFYTPVKNHILDPLGVKYTLLFDISGILDIVPYEKQCRIPRIKAYLDGDGLLVTSHEVKKNFISAGESELLKSDKVSFIEECVDLSKVHNSLMAYLYLLTYCNAKKIILFGCDGYEGQYIERNAILSYFCPKDVREDLEIAYGGAIYSGLPSDTETFNGTFKAGYVDYCIEKQLTPKKIIVANPNSFIDIFPRLSFEQVIAELEGDKNGKKSII